MDDGEPRNWLPVCGWEADPQACDARDVDEHERQILLPHIQDMWSAMLFVDGENLAKRVASLAQQRGVPLHNQVQHKPDVFVWSTFLSEYGHPTRITRRHYYSSMRGDDDARLEVERVLKELGFHAPHIFPRDKNGRSKRVDITLATDMLLSACRKHCNVAVLVAGDEDYVPLVEAVQREGVLVHVWFVPDGLSPKLQHAADRYNDISEWFMEKAVVGK